MSAQRRFDRDGDILGSSLLLVLGVIGFAILAFVSLFLAMGADSCEAGGANCNSGMIAAGYLIALVGPPLIFIASAIWTIVRLVRRRRAWPYAVVGSLVALVVWAIGAAMIDASIGR